MARGKQAKTNRKTDAVVDEFDEEEDASSNDSLSSGFLTHSTLEESQEAARAIKKASAANSSGEKT